MDRETSTLTGGCVCGKVRYRTDGPPLRITVCHCTWCQRRTGTAFGTECVFPIDRVTVVDSSFMRSYRHRSDLSGRWVEQDFCAECGSNIGLRLEAVPDIRSLSIGSFDDKEWLDATSLPVRHVFTRSKLPLAAIPADVDRHEMHFRA